MLFVFRSTQLNTTNHRFSFSYKVLKTFFYKIKLLCATFSRSAIGRHGRVTPLFPHTTVYIHTNAHLDIVMAQRERHRSTRSLTHSQVRRPKAHESRLGFKNPPPHVPPGGEAAREKSV